VTFMASKCHDSLPYRPASPRTPARRRDRSCSTGAPNDGPDLLGCDPYKEGGARKRPSFCSWRTGQSCGSGDRRPECRSHIYRL
jgi:hypothetical protein